MTQRPEPYAELVAERTFTFLDRLEAFANARGVSMAGVALAWLLADERVTQVVIGPGRPEHLEPIRDALAHPLTSDELAQIEGFL
jgi:aryl-alcohol dehydrogenase-like predicted oxidoreductase